MMNWSGSEADCFYGLAFSRKIKKENEMPTSNVQFSTSKIEVKQNLFKLIFASMLDVGRWTLDVRIVFLCGFLMFAAARADDAAPHHAPLPNLMQWETSGQPQDPIEAIDHHMNYIVDDLGDKKTDQPVQTKQKKVIGELDAIIKELEEQQKKSKTGKGSLNPTKPMEKSTLTKGPGGSGPLHDPKAGTARWGDLSPKEREQITQTQNDGFPPGYESVLANYYNRLAQEKVATDKPAPDNTTGPTTRPGDK
jgi:hypothetical protein